MPNHAFSPAFPAAAVAAVLLALAAGCDRQTATPIPPPDRPATAPAAEPPPPKIDPAALKPTDPTPATPGYLVGRVLGADGKSVALPGVRIEVQVGGFLASNLASVTETFEAGPDGVYVKKLRPGTYRQPTARIEFPFRDKTYRLPLVPVRGGQSGSGGGSGGGGGQQESADGLVQDFAWRLSGPRPGVMFDKQRPDTWIGGAAAIEYHSYREDLRRVIRPAPAGTKLVLTLAPQGPLADGSAGKPIVVTRAYNTTDTAVDDARVVDVPLAYYEINGEEHFPDGRKQPLLLMQPDRRWGDKVAGTFAADLPNAALRPVGIVISRRER